MEWSRPERAHLPFEIHTHDMSGSFSLNSNSVAVMGIRHMDDIRSESSYVGAFLGASSPGELG
jgi:hypothetical protein